tara:strand:+ start:232 stop:1422 length:1191 start_codon:yes stop_codon:yes gene_type:complete
MDKLNKYILIWFLLLLFSCDSMKTVNLYDSYEKKEDPFLSFQYKDVFTDSDKSGVYGMKVHPCKEISFDTINNFSGSDHLHLKWNKTKDCKWLGFGFKWGNFKSKNLLPFFDSSAIEFMIRSSSGKFSSVPILFSLADYSGNQCFSKISILGMEDGIVDQKWRKVTIPLPTFKHEKKGVNISNIKDLKIQLMNKGDFHIDDIKVVPYKYLYKVNKKNFTKKINTYPVILGNEKKYWWGVNENYTSNFKFTTSTNFANSNISFALSVDFDSKKEDRKWNSFGFPLNKWELADLSEIYPSSVLSFKIVSENIPKMKINFISYIGKPKNISKIISEKNIFQINEKTFEILIPVKSIKNYDLINWSKMKEIRFKVLETSKFIIGDFNLVKYSGNPQKPKK